jgi:hypothetical protein
MKVERYHYNGDQHCESGRANHRLRRSPFEHYATIWKRTIINKKAKTKIILRHHSTTSFTFS